MKLFDLERKIQREWTLGTYLNTSGAIGNLNICFSKEDQDNILKFFFDRKNFIETDIHSIMNFEPSL
jgi:hypothetical protein